MSKKHNKKQEQQKVGTEGNATVRQVKCIPNLMSCVFVHRTSETTADFEWAGSTLNSIWPTVLAFLKWTQDTYRSESQLRLFVNKNTGEWAPWAFPQKAHTGMSARELTDTDAGYERTKEQRVKFSDTEGWYYWGTVHHHCTSSAFQSGVDRHNEQNQDGIHITVGHLDKNQYDIHFRLYVGGFQLTSVNELDFWDTGGEMDTIPEKFRSLLPPNTELLLARQQMGVPAPAGTTFPEEWKANIVDLSPKSVATVTSSGVVISGGPSYKSHHDKTYTEKSFPNLEYDRNKALRKYKDLLTIWSRDQTKKINTWEGVVAALEMIDHHISQDIMDIFAICVECDLLPGDAALAIDQELAVEELKQQQRGQLSEGGHQPPKQKEMIVDLDYDPTKRAGVPGPQNHWYYGQD